MNDTIGNFNAIAARIHAAENKAGRTAGETRLVVVSKTFSADHVKPLLDHGQRLFGENRVQEAEAKWPALKHAYRGVELHLIGPLQSNKAGDAVALFDVIETVDREKIAAALAREVSRQEKKPAFYVQVNTGCEPQKAGVTPELAMDFVKSCSERHGLAITGLMCIPPTDQPPERHFALLAGLARQCGLKNLSMGMSGDFETAIKHGATHVRVGSAIFGTR